MPCSSLENLTEKNAAPFVHEDSNRIFFHKVHNQLDNFNIYKFLLYKIEAS